MRSVGPRYIAIYSEFRFRKGKMQSHGKFECIGRGRSAWCKRAELSRELIQNTKEAPPWNLCITWTGCTQEDDQLLREGQQWRGSFGRIESRYTLCPGSLEENAAAAVECGNGSDHV